VLISVGESVDLKVGVDVSEEALMPIISVKAFGARNCVTQ